MIQGENERRVVFMGGLYFRFHRLARTGVSAILIELHGHLYC